MAISSSFSALSRQSKRGVSSTISSDSSDDGNESIASMSIGAVDDFFNAYEAENAPPILKSVAPKNAVPPSAYALENDTHIYHGHEDQIDDFAKLEGLMASQGTSDDFASVATLVDELKEDRNFPQKTPLQHNSFENLSRENTKLNGPEPRIYKENESAFSGLSRGDQNSSSVRAARKDIASVKVVTRLVQGIIHSPGSQAQTSLKVALLRDQLIQVSEMSRILAASVAPQESNNEWVIGQCAEVVAELIAHASEFGHIHDKPKLDEQIQAIGELLGRANSDTQVARALDDFNFSDYQVATDPSVVKDRLLVSTASATWDLFQKVNDSGFLYGLDAVLITEKLTANLLPSASLSNIQISSLDMQTSHLQGCIRRLANLIGSEYMSQAIKIHTWIRQGLAEGDTSRESQANASFEAEILPKILLNAQNNFHAIEKIAPKLVDQSIQQYSTSQSNTQSLS